MLPIAASSSMNLFRFGFRLLLLICCVITITSYNIDHRPFEDRNERAVTEWRFRRNFLLSLPYFYANHVPNDHFENTEAVENENQAETYDKKYVPNLLYDRMNK